MTTRPNDPDATYLPERYRQKVQAKKQRRIYKKVGAAAIVIVVIIIAFVLFIGMVPAPLPSTPIKNPVTITPAKGGQNANPLVNVTAVVTPAYVTGTGISALHSPDLLSLDKALSLLWEEYPAETHTLVSVNLTDRYNDQKLYELVIQPADRSLTKTQITVFYDAVTGEPYTPGQENARITSGQAVDLARKAFPGIQPDLVRVRYIASADSGSTWNFTFVKGTIPLLTGTMDAETGQVSSFTRTINKLGRPAGPVIDMQAAQKIAAQYIFDQNGPVAVNNSESLYSPMGSPSDPVAGKYVFIYNRIVNDIPCDEDGFIIGVDSVTGDITAYARRWSASDNAFSVISEPTVLKREATFAVLQRAKEMYPDSVSSLRIVSAEIRWKDQHTTGITPRPGSIPLAWKVTFDDDIIRGNSSATPAIAWVDAQTNSIMDFEYQH